MNVSTYQLKASFQRLLLPILQTLLARQVSPDAVTLAAFVLSVAWGGALWRWADCTALWWATPMLLLTRIVLNALDGMLARASGRITRRGVLLNEVCDVLSDWALMLPWLTVPFVPATAVWTAVLMATLAEFAGVLALSVGSPRRFEGPMGKSDRALAMGILAVMHAAGVSGAWIVGCWVLVSALLVWTVWNRLRLALACMPPTP